MTSGIYQASPPLYPNLIDIWETSVRATHHFLAEEDIGFYKELLATYLPQIKVYCVNHGNQLAGFIGLSEGMVEALFVHPAFTGKGIGKRLLQFAVQEHGVNRVDVNEQNQEALGFYEHHGFEIIDRTELDPAGKNYPILMLQLPKEYRAKRLPVS
ncbi:GNAT family N-acetyltransferase [Pedobacter sp. SYSU D00535]|uniref:GNAT family N-acetyltransferase n=1 Tax=Pedobacter sp. SYSU D00535 TaxID=2810308 RepID=UPI001A9799FC|nr:GNAT family N-acetyltransferase [Pedobacter sp. SYSU D00535]